MVFELIAIILLCNMGSAARQENVSNAATVDQRPPLINELTSVI